ncbi:MAG: sigma-70 family RNA polymerase sigma factor [Chloroflexi bacterium HGW-Chloroflexi-3]|nr:MAG: sigma-70 family RNA polymerase sigma factor [Chloroflexi bacterium HGW-Chloroflexi-3]
METDHDLIQDCRRGDECAWERLLDKYERLVYSIPLNYGLTVDDAADVAQITFTILIRNLDSIRDDTRLAPWLATVARRHTWRLMARCRREQDFPDEEVTGNELLGHAADQNSPDPVERWERIEWLNYGLNLLGKRCRELLLTLYFDVEQPSYAEVARRFNMPVGSVGPTRARCLKQLKRLTTSEVQV